MNVAMVDRMKLWRELRLRLLCHPLLLLLL
jgi:hypothetical protein